MKKFILIPCIAVFAMAIGITGLAVSPVAAQQTAQASETKNSAEEMQKKKAAYQKMMIERRKQHALRQKAMMEAKKKAMAAQRCRTIAPAQRQACLAKYSK